MSSISKNPKKLIVQRMRREGAVGSHGVLSLCEVIRRLAWD